MTTRCWTWGRRPPHRPRPLPALRLRGPEKRIESIPMRFTTSGRVGTEFGVKAGRQRLRTWASAAAAVSAEHTTAAHVRFRNGTLITDDYAMYDTIGAPSL